MLAAYGIPVPESRASRPRADEVGEAGGAMLRDGGALAVKLLSPDVAHKSDVGGVALDIASAEAAEAAARASPRGWRKALPGAASTASRCSR